MQMDKSMVFPFFSLFDFPLFPLFCPFYFAFVCFGFCDFADSLFGFSLFLLLSLFFQVFKKLE